MRSLIFVLVILPFIGTSQVDSTYNFKTISGNITDSEMFWTFTADEITISYPEGYPAKIQVFLSYTGDFEGGMVNYYETVIGMYAVIYDNNRKKFVAITNSNHPKGAYYPIQ